LKLIAEQFSGDKRVLKEFCENVEAAYELIDLDKKIRRLCTDTTAII
jgi:hypothetical protein